MSESHFQDVKHGLLQQQAELLKRIKRDTAELRQITLHIDLVDKQIETENTGALASHLKDKEAERWLEKQLLDSLVKPGEPKEIIDAMTGNVVAVDASK